MALHIQLNPPSIGDTGDKWRRMRCFALAAFTGHEVGNNEAGRGNKLVNDQTSFG